MRRFICDNCGREFYIPLTVKEYRGEYFGRPVHEDVLVCPYCEDSNFYEEEEEEELW